MVDEVTYEVEKILKKKKIKENGDSTCWYLIKWKGYDASHNTWEPLSYLVGCPRLLRKFEEKHYKPNSIYYDVKEDPRDRNKPKIPESIEGYYDLPDGERLYLIQWKGRRQRDLVPASSSKYAHFFAQFNIRSFENSTKLYVKEKSKCEMRNSESQTEPMEGCYLCLPKVEAMPINSIQLDHDYFITPKVKEEGNR